MSKTGVSFKTITSKRTPVSRKATPGSKADIEMLVFEIEEQKQLYKARQSEMEIFVKKIEEFRTGRDSIQKLVSHIIKTLLGQDEPRKLPQSSFKEDIYQLSSALNELYNFHVSSQKDFTEKYAEHAREIFSEMEKINLELSEVQKKYDKAVNKRSSLNRMIKILQTEKISLEQLIEEVNQQLSQLDRKLIEKKWLESKQSTLLDDLQATKRSLKEANQPQNLPKPQKRLRDESIIEIERDVEELGKELAAESEEKEQLDDYLNFLKEEIQRAKSEYKNIQVVISTHKGANIRKIIQDEREQIQGKAERLKSKVDVLSDQLKELKENEKCYLDSISKIEKEIIAAQDRLPVKSLQREKQNESKKTTKMPQTSLSKADREVAKQIQRYKMKL